MKNTLLVGLLFLFQLNVAIANNGGVHGPTVKIGHSQFDARYTYANMDENKPELRASRFHYETSLNNAFKLRLVAGFKGFGTSQNSWELNAGKVELLYNFNKFDESSNSDKFASGIRFDLRARKGAPPEDFAVHWTNQYNMSSRYFARGILILGKNISGNKSRNIQLGSRFAIYKKINHKYQTGIELYDGYGKIDDVSPLDKQTHQIGPMFSGHIHFNAFGHAEKVKFFARYLRGLTDSTNNHTFSFRLTFSY